MDASELEEETSEIHKFNTRQINAIQKGSKFIQHSIQCLYSIHNIIAVEYYSDMYVASSKFVIVFIAHIHLQNLTAVLRAQVHMIHMTFPFGAHPPPNS